MDQVLEVLLYVKQREGKQLHLLRNSFKISYFSRNYFSVIKDFFEHLDGRLESPEKESLEQEDVERVRRCLRTLGFWQDFGRLLMQNSSIKERLRVHLEFNLAEIQALKARFLALEKDLLALVSVQQTASFMRDTLAARGRDEDLFQHRLYVVEDNFKQLKSFKSSRVENYYNRILEKFIRLKRKGQFEEAGQEGGRPLPGREGPGLNAQSAFYMGNMNRFRGRILDGRVGGSLGYSESKMVLVIFDSHEYLGEVYLSNLLADINNLLNQAWLESADFASKRDYIQRCELFVEDLSFLNTRILRHIRLLIKLDRDKVFKVKDVGLYLPG